ncbi:single-stranded-DNA-specific exonuclease RecJ [Candidatus Parcubacteria bacterium]|nr:single-stranded-DNA-specific exonuclease RecJ [Patescibacteria group bacterium]MBU4309294.1 single-stranded-DNA-specific exonuclease RecJ [Patescibacteria group bacterium]MBU4432271.1 single-stranded-DNA-specific exonuclease RecJ [Patescibacteria group bacterium]MBU4577655.1 single-stranded-DNA-specific exonuclease RecJ [Patescibacteria group bacterium]MCG2697341.1 single-stranded-DNA-specific exonuclease RecJ [Candidatus Parcubacteria bacterium]
MQKKWRLMPEISQDFINDNPDYSRVILQLLFNRGFTKKADIESLLKATYDTDANDPFLFNDMEKATEIVIGHIKAGNKIFIYGDYDADGVTSSSLLYDFLLMLKADVSVYIPDRVKEGYGVNKQAIDFISGEKAKLVITVDSGIRSKEEVAYAFSQGIEVIITDHHMPPENREDWPNCLIINPSMPTENYPYKFLAGVGVAFKLATAILSKAKLNDEMKMMIEKRMLDLVAVGTVADCVPLLGENRILVREGLKSLQDSRRIGLKELLKASKIDDKKVSSWNIGFQIAPRINAAGRMDHANTAFDLMITKDEGRALELATELNDRNIQRQEATVAIFNQVDDQVKDSKDKILIGIFDLDKEKQSEIWNEGVIGLVAGRICEKYYKPTLVITKVEDGYKGSGRSIEEFNLIEAIAGVSELLEKFGGHPMACGLSLSDKKIDEFKQTMIANTNEFLKDVELAPSIKIEADLKITEINETLISDIARFEPFGQGNDRPKFSTMQAVIIDKMFMGSDNQHVKFKLKQQDSNVINALGFGQSKKWEDLNPGQIIDLVYNINLNEFNGRTEIQMIIVDIK